MTLTFLGKGAAFYPAYGNTGAYFWHGKNLYLLDCGETTFGILQQKGVLDSPARVYVLVTHLHADHVGSLASLISYLYYEKNIQPVVFHPEQTINALLALEGIEPMTYHYLPHMTEPDQAFIAEPVKVKHVEGMECYGYLLKSETEVIYYSGDAAEIPADVLTAFLNGAISRIYQDTATHDSEHPSHYYYKEMETVIPRELRSKVYCMHLDGPYEDILKESGFQIVEVVEAT